MIPASMENIDSTTYKLMNQFLAGGGKIISFASEITYLDGSKSDAIMEMLKKYPEQCLFVNGISDPLVKEIFSREGFSISELSTSHGELYHQRRILDDGQLLILVNSSEDKSSTASIKAMGKSVIIMDPVSGMISQVPATSGSDGLYFNVDLNPVGSALYFISSGESSLPLLQTSPGGETPVIPNSEFSEKRKKYTHP